MSMSTTERRRDETPAAPGEGGPAEHRRSDDARGASDTGAPAAPREDPAAMNSATADRPALGLAMMGIPTPAPEEPPAGEAAPGPTPWPGGRRRNWRAALMLVGAVVLMGALLSLWAAFRA